jgi:pSer/pThr/pTyr-binding forkhead associated (FHA) protein
MQLTGRTLRIGRDASNDIVADDLRRIVRARTR